ncbi:MAG: PQQ-binding-like beta-propeller repeat protein [Acidobacteriota bacterium]
MPSQATSETLRVWPGWIVVVLQWIATFGVGAVMSATMVHFLSITIGPGLGLLLLLLWWTRTSHASRGDKIAVAVALPVAIFVAFLAADRSAKMAVYTHGIPLACLAFVAAATLMAAWNDARRRSVLVAVVVVAAAGWTLVRSEGVDGDMDEAFAWRWAPTAEERLLAADDTQSARPVATAADTFTTPAWPGFRGADRDGVVATAPIATDWQATPPIELWRRPIGPGWGSFAVAGDLLFTQEQRGDEEAVSAYHRATGEPVWRHREPVRFWEAMAGPGPRATPTFADGRLYALGATGLLNALDAADGSPIWRRDVATDLAAPLPDWGFSASPLVVDGLVVIHVPGAAADRELAAYDALTGEPRWFAPAAGQSYVSPHLGTIDGVRQILIATSAGATSVAPADGAVLWRHEWSAEGGARCVQPAITPDGDVIIGTGFGVGIRRLDPTPQGDAWSLTERWTSTRMKAYFNDFVLHDGSLYGFDNRILASLDLATGERRWKGGRFGNGQMVLLAEQGLLLVISDRGEIALVEASPDGFREVTRTPAIEGKTWNHPVIVDGILYVRNGQEMAAFELPPAAPAAG